MIPEDEASEWVADAEAARRAGRPAEARRLVEAGLVEEPHALRARVVLALACLDLGDAAAAREALEPALARFEPGAREPLAIDAPSDEPFAVQSDPLADLAENELERAIENAESEPALTWTTNRVAEAALRAVEAGDLDDDAPFATETVARLYEGQGDAARAQEIRRTLAAAPASLEIDTVMDTDPRTRWVGTLERWLDNLRRASR